MVDISIEEIFKLADELGIEYELNSENAGFFVLEEDGFERKVSIEELLKMR